MGGQCIIPGMSGDDTVFSKVQIVHGFINNFFNLLPVAPPLYEFVNVLPWSRTCFVSRIALPDCK
jgi:hypothetical protein